MENMLIDEKTINKNIQYALSVIAENVDKDGNLIVPEPTSLIVFRSPKQPKLFRNNQI